MIFNMPEDDNETMQQCEQKVLALFNGKMKLDIKLESIDLLHRIGRKVAKNPESQLDLGHVNVEEETEENKWKQTVVAEECWETYSKKCDKME